MIAMRQQFILETEGLSLCNPVLSTVKDLSPTIQLADFPRISVALPEATGHRESPSLRFYTHYAHKIKTIPMPPSY